MHTHSPGNLFNTVAKHSSLYVATTHAPNSTHCIAKTTYQGEAATSHCTCQNYIPAGRRNYIPAGRSSYLPLYLTKLHTSREKQLPPTVLDKTTYQQGEAATSHCTCQNYIPAGRSSYHPLYCQNYIPAGRSNYLPLYCQNYIPAGRSNYLPLYCQNYIPAGRSSYLPLYLPKLHTSREKQLIKATHCTCQNYIPTGLGRSS